MYDLQSIVRPLDLAGAVAALAADREALPIAGGTDVLIKIREGRLAGCRLVSLHDLEELKGVFIQADKTLRIGPGTTFSELAAHPLILTHLPMLAEAVGQVGGPQVRAAGTVGGNLCNGAPSADSAPSLLCMNATLELTGPDATRSLSIHEFYSGPGRVHRAQNELLTAICIAPEDYQGFGGHYIKCAQREAMDIATLGCAAYVRLTADRRRIEELRLAFGVAAPTPIRAAQAEAAAKGEVLCAALADRVAAAAQQDINPRSSWRASREYRLQLAEELVRRALGEAVQKAGGVLDA